VSEEQRRRVLVVEDSPTQAERLRLLLESERFEVIHAPSAEAALDRLESARPDAIVLDYHLPGMNGGEFCREIRLNVNTRAIPVLMLTVEGSDDAQTRGLDSGADDYLGKTADPDILLARLRALLRKSAEGSAIMDAEIAFARARLLVIHSSATYLHYLVEDLRGERYVVDGAGAGREGLSRVRDGAFDCVLLEAEMPGLDGIEACRRIVETDRGANAPILVLLAEREDKEQMSRALRAGADDYISRSAEIGVIKARVRALLRRRFLIEENRRIADELKEKEMEAVRARAETQAAEVRALMADRLGDANRELERANRKLKEALAITRVITDNAVDALFLIDNLGCVTFLNPAAEKLFGFSRAEMLGRELHEAIHRTRPDGSPYPALECPVTRCIRNGTAATDVDEVFFRKDGTPVDISCSVAPVLHEGRPAAAVLVMHDISEKKRVDERLRESQKLESIGLLAGGIAHDFNNLLVGIVGNASLGEEMVPAGHPVTDILTRIVKTGEQAAHLTRQMLAYAGKGRFIIEPVDLSGLVRELIPLIQPSISKRISVHLDLSRAVPPVEADRSQLQQVFMNLLINAAEAIGSGPGVVSVSTGARRVEAGHAGRPAGAELEPGEYACLKVTDTGCGMDEATRAKIFDPFFTTKFTGRGLGLAAVAGIIRGHKGGIHVASAPGKGTSFVVLFPPAARAAPAPAPPAREDEDLRGSGAILVIDDEQAVRQLAKRALERYGYSVLTAESGQAGVNLFRKESERVVLVVLDLSMPGMNGQETLAELRNISPEIEVVISSGYAEADTMPLFAGVEVSGFIQKPYTSRHLARIVKGVISPAKPRG
jgi:PAS domain S-box-containing protein